MPFDTIVCDKSKCEKAGTETVVIEGLFASIPCCS